MEYIYKITVDELLTPSNIKSLLVREQYRNVTVERHECEPEDDCK